MRLIWKSLKEFLVKIKITLDIISHSPVKALVSYCHLPFIYRKHNIKGIKEHCSKINLLLL